MSDLSWVADKATGILIPSGYKAGTLYGIVPTSQYTTGIPKNAFDFTFARASIAKRTNEAGLIETMANDVPRLQYPSCPPVLFEPARSNLFLNSDVGVTQTITLVNGSVYSMYFFEGAGTITLSGAHTATLTASDHAYSGAITFTAATTSLVCTVTGAADQVQCELGTYPTTYVATGAATANRAVDARLTSSLIQYPTELSFYVDIHPFERVGSNGAIIGQYNTLSSERAWMCLPTSDSMTALRLTLSGNGTSFIFFTFDLNKTILNKRAKVAVSISTTEINMSLDGILLTPHANTVGALYSVAQPVNISGLTSIPNDRFFGEYFEAIIFPTALTDAELIELTQ